MKPSDQLDSGLCGAKPSYLNVSCLLDVEHGGAHRWWDEASIVAWVPHSERWREIPAASARPLTFDEEPADA